MLSLSKISFNYILSNVLSREEKKLYFKYRRLLLKFEKHQLHLNFLEECLQIKVIPKFLKISIPLQYRCFENLFIPSQLKILKKVIKEIKWKIKDLQKSINDLDASNTIILCAKYDIKREINHTKFRQEKKLNKLTKTKISKEQFKVKNSVINISSRKLNEIEEKALSYGMKMSWMSSPNILNTKVSTEVFFENLCKQSKFNKHEEEEYKFEIKKLYNNYVNTKIKIPNNVKMMTNALRNLSKDKTIYINRFDKGNGTLICDRNYYVSKMNEILDDTSKFEELKNQDITKSFIKEEERINNSLKSLLQRKQISKEFYEKCRTTGSIPARLYGLPKIHKCKEQPPMRPVLSSVNNSTYNLSKELDKIIKPFIPTKYNLKNTEDFLNKLELSSKSFDSNKVIMSSLDAKSLFTNIPIEETIDHIINIIPNDEIEFDTSILRSLLKLACTNTLFLFNNNIYKQTNGMAMGSPLGSTMATFCLDIIESKFENLKSNLVPSFYCRYVDDIFCIFKNNDELHEFQNFMNSHLSSIKFTSEIEQSNTLIFLDSELLRTKDKIESKWHIKSTNTGLYIPYESYCTARYKINTIRTLINRIFTTSSNYKNLTEATDKLFSILTNNGYPHHLIKKCLDKYFINNKLKDNNDKTKNIYWNLPYIKERQSYIEHQLKRINKKLKIYETKIIPTFTTTKTSNFFSNKDPIPMLLSSSIVYKYSCDECNASYIGETRRHLEIRIKEHLRGHLTSEIYLHHHQATKDHFKILTKNKHTKITEALLIKQQRKKLLNRQLNHVSILKLF